MPNSQASNGAPKPSEGVALFSRIARSLARPYRARANAAALLLFGPVGEDATAPLAVVRACDSRSASRVLDRYTKRWPRTYAMRAASVSLLSTSSTRARATLTAARGHEGDARAFEGTFAWQQVRGSDLAQIGTRIDVFGMVTRNSLHAARDATLSAREQAKDRRCGKRGARRALFPARGTTQLQSTDHAVRDLLVFIVFVDVVVGGDVVVVVAARSPPISSLVAIEPHRARLRLSGSRCDIFSSTQQVAAVVAARATTTTARRRSILAYRRE